MTSDAQDREVPSARDDVLLALIVDDVEEDRLLLVRTVGERGFEVLEASGGEEAVRLTMERKPDLIVLDILMPEMDGLDALERIRDEAADVPVVIVTAADDPGHGERALDLGAVNFLRKPLDVAEIQFVVERIRAVLEEEADLRRALPLVRERRTRLELASDLGQISAAVAYLGRELRLHYPGLEVPCTSAKLALTEALANAIEHGNLEVGYRAKSQALKQPGGLRSLIQSRPADLRRRVVEVDVCYAADRVSYRIRDQGGGFAPHGADKPWRTGQPFAQHGRGILLIEHMMENVSWNEAGNEIRMTLPIGPRRSPTGLDGPGESADT